MTTKKFLIRIAKISFICLMIAGVVYACKKDEEEPVNNPSIELVAPASTDLMLEVNGQFDISFIANSNTTSGAALKTFQLFSYFGNNDPVTIEDSIISGTTFTVLNYSLTVSDMPGTQVFTIQITDADGGSASVKITVTVQEENALAPEVSFKTGDFVNRDTILPTNTHMNFGVIATANAETNAKIVNLTVRRKYESTSTTIVTSQDYNDASIDWEGSGVAHPNVGNEIWTFRVTDENDEYAVVSFTVTTESAGPGMLSYTGIVLGSTSGNINQGISLVNGETLKLQELTEQEDQKKVDLVYFEDDTYGNTLVCPKHNVAGTVYGTTIGNWLDANRSKTFISKKTSINASTFNSIQDISQLVTVISINGGVGTSQLYSEEQTLPHGFAVNDIFAFETLSGNVGLILIKEVNEGSTPSQSSIQFDFKVESDK